MKREMILVLIFLSIADRATAEPPAADCAYDKSAMLSLDYDAFEKDMEGGWRPLGSITGCEAVTADLLQEYRVQRIEPQRRGMMHHEVQLRAAAGQYEEATALLRDILTTQTDPAMVAYHEAEIAFLKKDRPALEAARETLAGLPYPKGWESGVAKFKARFPDLDAPVWPMNLDVIDGFLNCFDKPYAEAYSFSCRPEK